MNSPDAGSGGPVFSGTIMSCPGHEQLECSDRSALNAGPSQNSSITLFFNTHLKRQPSLLTALSSFLVLIVEVVL